MLSRSRQTGLSLVELMVGLVVGLIVVAGAGAMYVTTVRGQTYALRAAKLNQDLRATMNIIASDVRRSGYWGGAIAAGGAPAPLPHPYTLRGVPQTDVTILEGGTCVMYAYDADGDATDLTTETNQEVFGFRLNGSVVQMLDDVITDTSNCATGTWGAMTSNDTIVIDALSFSSTGSQCMNATGGLSWQLTAANSTLAPCAAPAADITMNSGGVHAAPVAGDLMTEVRQLTIVLIGHHQSDPTMASTVIETVHLPNNRVFNAP